MKKFALVLTVLATISSAHATSTIRTVADCTLAKPMDDTGIEVKVTEYTGPGTIGHAADFNATVTQFFLGRKNTTNYSDLLQKLPPALEIGGGTSYVGSDFSLDLCTDCAPINGKISGTVTYEVDGQRNVDQVACEINR